jgi:hypothetical protein
MASAAGESDVSALVVLAGIGLVTAIAVVLTGTLAIGFFQGARDEWRGAGIGLGKLGAVAMTCIGALMACGCVGLAITLGSIGFTIAVNA